MSDKPDLDWYPSRAPSSNGQSLHRIFFYHIPKTGGTTVQTVLTRAYDALLRALQKQGAKMPPMTIGRVENWDHVTLDTFKNNYVLMSSHLPYPFHEKFGSDFELVTIVRDPFRRLYSYYTYRSMRSREQPSAKGFENFIREERNRNYQAKFLAGTPIDEPAEETGARTQAWANLQNKFAYFGTTDHIHAITTHLLAQSCLPNVLSERLNVTRKTYQFDAAALEQEVRERNAEDCRLYEQISTQPRLGPSGAADQPPHPQTIISFEAPESSDEKFVGNNMMAPTAQIFSHIKDGKMPRAVFERLLASATRS